jgi:uncharacterized protein YyaL (SSP411 family)
MIAGAIERANYYASLLKKDVAKGRFGLPRATAADSTTSLAAAIDWLCRAQDATPDGGVARSYSLAYHPFFRRAGWIPSYPETTGYIIPTLFDYAKMTGRDDLAARALRMADWECDVQMSNGAVQGGTINAAPTPAIFNTGQVIFGWVRAYEETRVERYLTAARRAGDFLLETQDADGAWRKSLSAFASTRMHSYTYNTRTAWGLYLLGCASGNRVYQEAATRNVDFALTEQLPNGWFKNNCLYDPSRPLLHTIAYSLRGILEIGLAGDRPRYVAAAQKAADALFAAQDEDGRLAGRFDDRWNGAMEWSCLTGNAQMGTVWARLYQATGDRKYFTGLARANRFLRRVQWLGTGNPGLDGGINGSDPINGRYGPYEVLNWAVKFFADSLMFEATVAPPAGESRA